MTVNRLLRRKKRSVELIFTRLYDVHAGFAQIFRYTWMFDMVYRPDSRLFFLTPVVEVSRERNRQVRGLVRGVGSGQVGRLGGFGIWEVKREIGRDGEKKREREREREYVHGVMVFISSSRQSRANTRSLI